MKCGDRLMGSRHIDSSDFKLHGYLKWLSLHVSISGYAFRIGASLWRPRYRCIIVPASVRWRHPGGGARRRTCFEHKHKIVVPAQICCDIINWNENIVHGSSRCEATDRARRAWWWGRPGGCVLPVILDRRRRGPRWSLGRQPNEHYDSRKQKPQGGTLHTHTESASSQPL